MTQITQQGHWFLVNQLLVVTEKKVRHLKLTATRINALKPDLKWVEALEERVEQGEMLDAFVSRFSRLQDTLGDKLLPALLRASLERTGSQLDSLLRYFRASHKTGLSFRQGMPETKRHEWLVEIMLFRRLVNE